MSYDKVKAKKYEGYVNGWAVYPDGKEDRKWHFDYFHNLQHALDFIAKEARKGITWKRLYYTTYQEYENSQGGLPIIEATIQWALQQPTYKERSEARLHDMVMRRLNMVK